MYVYTRSSTKQLDPRWDEYATFEVASSTDVVHAVMFDWNRINKHVFMGEVTLHLSELRRQGDKLPGSGWYKLEKPESIDEGVSGELQISVSLEATGRDQWGDGWNPSTAGDVRELSAAALPKLSVIEEHRHGSQHGLFDGEVVKIERPKQRPLGKLRVQIIEAQDLTAMDTPEGGSIVGSSDPYVEVHLEGSYWRTKTVSKNLNPSWTDPPQEIPFHSFDALMHVLIFDHDSFSSDDYLGEVLLPVGALALRDGEERDMWLKVQAPVSHSAPITGYLRITCKMLEVDPNHRNYREPSRLEQSLGGRRGGVSSSSVKSPIKSPTRSSGTGSAPTSSAPRPSSSSRSYAEDTGGDPGMKVRRGTYWRGIRGKDIQASPFDLSNTHERSRIEKWMNENRDRGFQMFDLGTGAKAQEKLAKIPDASVRYWLRVNLVSGHDLLSADDNGFSDPYCDLYVLCPSRESCKHMWRSTTKFKTLNPKWDETQRVPLVTDGALLHLVCFDWDKVGTDDFLGESLLDLKQYCDGRLHRLKVMLDQYQTMKTNDDNEEVRGHIVLEVQMTSDRR